MFLSGGRYSGVYCIQHRASGKRYIGSTRRTIASRLKEYLRDLPKGRCHNRHLQRAWDKYGEDAFSFSILERCSPADCLNRETYWIEKYRSTDRRFGYNIYPAGGGSFGVKHSAEFRAKVSARFKGKKQTPEQKAKRAAAWVGRKHSAASIAKMSAAKKGKKHSLEARAKMSAARRGKKQSPESVVKRAAANRGKKRSTATRTKFAVIQRAKGKLTETVVLEMRSIWAAGEWTLDRLAARFGVSRGTVHDAVSGRTWTLPDQPDVRNTGGVGGSRQEK